MCSFLPFALRPSLPSPAASPLRACPSSPKHQARHCRQAWPCTRGSIRRARRYRSQGENKIGRASCRVRTSHSDSSFFSIKKPPASAGGRGRFVCYSIEVSNFSTFWTNNRQAPMNAIYKLLCFYSFAAAGGAVRNFSSFSVFFCNHRY